MCVSQQYYKAISFPHALLHSTVQSHRCHHRVAPIPGSESPHGSERRRNGPGWKRNIRTNQNRRVYDAGGSRDLINGILGALAAFALSRKSSHGIGSGYGYGMHPQSYSSFTCSFMFAYLYRSNKIPPFKKTDQIFPSESHAPLTISPSKSIDSTSDRERR